MEPNQSPQPSNQPKNSFLPKLAVLAVLIVAYVAFAAFRNSNKEQAQPADSSRETSGNTAQTQPGQEQAALSRYKDGSYEVLGTYTSPAGPENIKVSLTLTDGIITAAEVIPQATNQVSVKMQADFAANYKTQVIGKNIEGLELSKVSGSSLTPKGFNDALEKIKAQTQS